jgi:CheY-like chemotaxis protein
MLGFHHTEKQKPRILVVDDDPMFDGLVVDHLTEDGEYVVFSSRSGDQALKILEQTNVDVLITDIKMPNTDGFELVNHVRTEYPNLSVVVISGYGRPRWLDRGDDSDGIQFLEKPINFSRLKKVVRKAVYNAVPVPRDPHTTEERMDDSMLSGQAAQFPLLDMIQICCIAERTGCVTLRRGGSESRIFLDQGEIVHAEAGGLHGAEAFYELASWDDADFVFENTVPAPEKTIFKAWESLVYEGIQRRAARVVN